ncbi:MAG: hypothetical protein RMM98_13815 [Acidobacteriota bacterium]|nr:hypothetical protein [Acidobacteriota bacterium]
MIREEILQLLRSDQAFREELRRQLLTEDLLALPARFDQLTEVVRELAEAVHNLAQAQQRTEEVLRRQGEQIERNSEQIRALIEAQRRTEEVLRRQGEQIERNSEQIQALIEAQQRTEEVLRRQGEQIERNSEQIRALIEAQQRTEEVLRRQGEQIERNSQQIQALIEAQCRTDAAIQSLTEAQRRTDAAIQNLTEAQRRTDAAIQSLTEAQQRTEAALRETQLELRALVNWQRGEAGRRDGEQYERETLRRAFVLFNGGQGGSPEQLAIQQQLGEWLKPLLRQGSIDLKPDQDPFLADLIWWKGERVAVVEISTQVNGYDVYRAVNRAETLRQAGVQAFPVVIGKEWANEESQRQAYNERVEWKVGADLSDGFLAFRQAASP